VPFPYVDDINDASIRRALAFGLGSTLTMLGAVQIVKGFGQSDLIAVLHGLKAVIRGAWAIYDVVKGREKSWKDIAKLAFSVVLLLVSLCGRVDELFKRFV
jgi:hypothetical protein